MAKKENFEKIMFINEIIGDPEDPDSETKDDEDEEELADEEVS